MKWPPDRADGPERIEHAFRTALAPVFGEDDALTLDDFGQHRSGQGRKPSLALALLFDAIRGREQAGDPVNIATCEEERDKLLQRDDIDAETRTALKHSVTESTPTTYHKSKRKRGTYNSSMCSHAILRGAYKPAAHMYVALTPAETRLMRETLSRFSPQDRARRSAP
jgi:hypothetical protein